MPPYRFKVDDLVMCRTGPEEWSRGTVVQVNYQEPNMPEPVPYQVELYDGALIYVPMDVPQLCKALQRAWWEGLFSAGKEGLRGQLALRSLEAELAAGRSPNERSTLGDTLLIAALRSDWLAGASAALRAGADPNMGSASFVRPLTLAVKHGPDAVELLLAARADPNLQEKHPNQSSVLAGFETVSYSGKSVTFEQREWHRVPLHYAARDCLRSCILLIDAKAAVCMLDGQYKQPLHVALECGNLDIAELLLSRRADADTGNAVIGLSSTPLLDATYRGDAPAVELLLRHRADVNHQGKLGNTALHLVCRAQHAGVAVQLLAAGADPMLRNDSGKTAAELAEANRARELAAKRGSAEGDGQQEAPVAAAGFLAQAKRFVALKLAELQQWAPEPAVADKLSCSIITGLLGSGKTTLVNHILRENHGKRIAVIENECGEVGIDDEFAKGGIIGQEEDIVEMNNGCTCGTVRGDLIRSLHNLFGKTMESGRPLNRVIVETTGLADLGPVAQSFFADDFVRQNVVLDGILAVVDAEHIIEQLDEEKPESVGNEAVHQIAFADRILLNKCDLADEAHLAEVERRIRLINAVVPIKRAVNSVIDMSFVLGIRAFSLEEVLAREEEFLANEQDQQDNRVSSVGLDLASEVDEQKLQCWLRQLLKERGADLFRSRGVLAVKGRSQKLVFQAVHVLSGMAYHGQWKPMERRVCRFVFIGKNLDRKELSRGFSACRAAQ